MQNPKDRRAQARLHKRREHRRLASLRTRPARLAVWQEKAPLANKQRFVHASSQESFVTFYANQADMGRPWKDVSPTMDVRFPRRFSFIENPEDTMRILERLAQCSCDNRVVEIEISHSRCRTIDYCAEAVAAALAVGAREKHRKGFRGQLPQDRDLRRMVIAAGMPRSLGLDAPTPRDFIVYPVKHGRRERSSYTTRAEKATQELVDYIDKCLITLGFTLSTSARRRYSNLVSEVITNAEAHSNRPDWWVGAYYKIGKPGEGNGAWGECHITIFCFGESLADSLRRLSSESILRKAIERRVEHHARMGFSRRWTEDDLWTLFAIQRGVSRRNDGEKEVDDYGQGTADLISAFHALAGSRTPPKMCLVSGNTHILFDGKHRIKTNASGRDRIAFNKDNSLSRRPESRYVRHIKRRFPGTLVSLRFALDQEHLNAISN